MNIKVEGINKELSSFAGLIIFKEIQEKLLPDFAFSKVSIPLLRNRISDGISKLRQLLFGFVAGADCLDDLDKLGKDCGFRAICGSKLYTARSLGNYLRSFSQMHCKELNLQLMRMAVEARRKISPDSASVTFDIDSTQNLQHAKKMEGIAFDYAGISGLNTIQVFDDLGFQYWNDVRPGNTHTANGAIEIIHRLFYTINPHLNGVTKYVRADSGYCKISFFQACSAKSAEFVVCMRKMMYKPLIKKVSTWIPQCHNDPNRIKFTGGRECEVGETLYKPAGCHQAYRVVIIRALKKDAQCQKKLFFTEEDYDYLGWVASLSPNRFRSSEVIKFYRKRGHAENFIRELKNGLDLHHYPCQKLTANKAYGVIAAMAHNLMRFIALKSSPEKPPFAKSIRTKFVMIPCQVVRHAGDLTFRFMHFHLKEVRKWLMEIIEMKVCFVE